MTGEQHFREAEQDIELANDALSNDADYALLVLARAQVHATLALAAATAQATAVTHD